MAVETPMPKQLLLRPFRAGANSLMNYSEFLQYRHLPVTCSKCGKKLSVQGAIDFGVASHWLKTGMRFFSQSLSIGIAIV